MLEDEIIKIENEEEEIARNIVWRIFILQSDSC